MPAFLLDLQITLLHRRCRDRFALSVNPIYLKIHISIRYLAYEEICY